MYKSMLIYILLVLFSYNGLIAAENTHPRLFFNADEIEQLRKNRMNTHREEWQGLLQISNELQGKNVFANAGSKVLFAEAEKLSAVALVQLLDPSQPYLPFFKKSFLQILKWSEWDQWIQGKGKGPSNDLGLGQGLIALSAAYDWQYHNFKKDERSYIEERLVAIADHFHDEYGRFSTNRIDIMNCNHGNNAYAGVTAVLYVSDQIPQSIKEKWEKTLDHKYNRLTSVMNDVMSDGASDEGATYYMTQLKFYMQWFEMIRNAKFKSKFQPYSDLEWFKNTSTYCLYTILPGGNDNFGGLARFADCNPNFWGNHRSVFPALARALNDPIA